MQLPGGTEASNASNEKSVGPHHITIMVVLLVMVVVFIVGGIFWKRKNEEIVAMRENLERKDATVTPTGFVNPVYEATSQAAIDVPEVTVSELEREQLQKFKLESAEANNYLEVNDDLSSDEEF